MIYKKSWFYRWFLLFPAVLVFSFDLLAGYKRLRESEEPMMLPKGCLEQEVYPCGVKTEKLSRKRIKVENGKIVLGENSAILLGEDLQSFKFFQGLLFVESKGRLQVETEFGELKVGKGEVLLEHNGDRVYIRSMTSVVLMKPIGSSSFLMVKPGFENWISYVAKDERVVASLRKRKMNSTKSENFRSSTGFPQVIDYEEQIKLAASLHYGSQEAFDKRIERFKGHWITAIFEVRNLHKKIAQETIAEEEQRRVSAKKAYLRKVESEKELRKLFRQRTLYE